ncbi:hypothetical protein [Tenacibaculum phage JQ]|nr:hypothetical protein [Tenacibaculum phage JQ]
MDEIEINKKLQKDLANFLNRYNFKGLSRTDVNNVIDLIRLKNIGLSK